MKEDLKRTVPTRTHSLRAKTKYNPEIDKRG